MRGPVVYCLEDVDNPCPVDQVAISADATFETDYRDDLLGGVTVLRTQGKRRGIVETDEGLDVVENDVDLTMIPYYAWDNREPGNMAVWIPTDLPKAAKHRKRDRRRGREDLRVALPLGGCDPRRQ